MTNQTEKTGKKFGFITWQSVPELIIPHAELLKLVVGCGLEKKLVPRYPSHKNAFEKATNIGRRGKTIEAPEHLKEAIHNQHGFVPAVRVAMESVNRKMPILRRQLSLKVTVPTEVKPGKNGKVKVKDAAKQLYSEPIATFEYNCDTDTLTIHRTDSEWALDSEIDPILTGIEKEFNRRCGTMDDYVIREIIRKHMASVHATTLRDGTYFVPASKSAELQNLFCFFDAIAPFFTVKSDPSFGMVPVTQDGQNYTQRTIKSVKVSFHDTVLKKLERLKFDMRKEKEKKRDTPDKIKQGFIKRALSLSKDLSAYQSDMEDDFAGTSPLVKAMIQKTIEF